MARLSLGMARRPVSATRAPLPRKPRKRAAKLTRWVLQGGPLDGAAVRLSCAGTLPLQLAGQRGRYNCANKWVAL